MKKLLTILILMIAFTAYGQQFNITTHKEVRTDSLNSYGPDSIAVKKKMFFTITPTMNNNGDVVYLGYLNNRLDTLAGYVDSNLRGVSLPSISGQAGNSIRVNGGETDWEYYTPSTGGIDNIVEDVTPQLGGNLDFNGFGIGTLVITDTEVGYLNDVTSNIQTQLNGKADLTGDTFTGDISVPDEVYGVGWDASVEVPTKNALYDKIETINSELSDFNWSDTVDVTVDEGIVFRPTATGGVNLFFDDGPFPPSPPKLNTGYILSNRALIIGYGSGFSTPVSYIRFAGTPEIYDGSSEGIKYGSNSYNIGTDSTLTTRKFVVDNSFYADLSNISKSPTASEDGKVLAWDNTAARWDTTSLFTQTIADGLYVQLNTGAQTITYEANPWSLNHSGNNVFQLVKSAGTGGMNFSNSSSSTGGVSVVRQSSGAGDVIIANDNTGTGDVLIRRSNDSAGDVIISAAGTGNEVLIYQSTDIDNLSDSAGVNKKALVDYVAASGSAWGDITGTLSNQTDLQNALDTKIGLPAATYNVTGSGSWSVFTGVGSMTIGATAGSLTLSQTHTSGSLSINKNNAGDIQITKNSSGAGTVDIENASSGDVSLTASGTGTITANGSNNPASRTDSTIVNEYRLQQFVQSYLTASLTDGAPTDAEIDSATGTTPAAVGAGRKYVIKDSDGTGLVYVVISDGTNWYYFVGTAAL